MKILVFGNIGSGKTTFCKALSEHLSDWEYLAIDDFRRTYGDNTFKGDSIAKSHFIKSITHDDSLQLIESSGFGRLGSSLARRLQKYEGELIVLVLLVKGDQCKQRLESREWDVPFPENTTKGDALVKKMDKLIFSNFLFERWSTREKTLFIQAPHIVPNDTLVLISTLTSYINTKGLANLNNHFI